MGNQVLVTRPEKQSEPLSLLLSRHQWLPISLPFLAIESLSDTDEAYRKAQIDIRELSRVDQVIFVSTNAVAHGFALIKCYYQELPSHIQWLAVGTATADVLAKELERFSGQKNIAAPTVGMDSEAILKLPSLQEVAGQRIIIIRGVGGRNFLAESLQQAGADVVMMELYRRCCPNNAAALACLYQDNKIDVVIVASGETLQNYIVLAQQAGILSKINKLPVVVPGVRVARIARQQGFEVIITAANATTDAMVDALNRWRDKNNGSSQ